WPNETLRKQMTFLEGKLEGQAEFYHKTGKPDAARTGTYADGKLQK
ncbi:MAG: antitoxin component YwqK of YwqJK toxin-antitoxin module, partial [Planctomycetota bacterium]